MDKVYIIILNYNGWHDTIECLESINQLSYGAYQVLICDNGSTDDSCKEIMKWIDENNQSQKYVLLTSSVNKGYSAGNNLGIEYACKKNDFAYIWILNNDTVVDKNSLSELVKKAKASKKIGGVGSVIIDYYKREKIQLIGNKLDLLNFNLKEIHPDTYPREVPIGISIDTLPGPSFILTRDFVLELGKLDESYFLYCEEMDVAEQAKKNHKYLSYAENSYVYHKGSVSTMKKSTAFREYHLVRSWFRYLQKWHMSELVRFESLQKKLILNRLFHGHIKRAWAIYRALKDGKIS